MHTNVLLLAFYAQNQSRGFVFVHFEDAETARLAATAMHGKPLEGKPLVVRLRSENADKSGPPRMPGSTAPFHVRAFVIRI